MSSIVWFKVLSEGKLGKVVEGGLKPGSKEYLKVACTTKFLMRKYDGGSQPDLPPCGEEAYN